MTAWRPPTKAGPAAPACPFNRAEYAAGLSNIGAVEPDRGGRFALLRRGIAGTQYHDGMGPWPYLWIGGPGDLAALTEDFRHLVTITAVAQPGYVPPAALADAVLLKHHYVYDPALPAREVSRRVRARLRRCEAGAAFAIVTDRGERLAMIGLYEGLKQRRNLAGTFVDFPDRHFECVAGLDCGMFFRVADAAGIGAMACGVLFGGMLQILHIATSPEGLRWNASYLLMQGLQEFARRQGVWLLTGGMPDRGGPGLQRFKQRWVNRMEPVYMLRIVNDPGLYATLCAGRAGAGYFPAYRRASG